VRINLANQVSLLRIFLIPVFVFLFLSGKTFTEEHRMFWALMVFILAAFTDLVDGYLARNLERVTKFGKLLDPIADKLLVTAALLCLLDSRTITVWLVLLLIGRDIAVQGLRLVALSQGEVIDASIWGKIKTLLQMFAIVFALTVFTISVESTAGGYCYQSTNGIINWLSVNGSTTVTWLMWTSVVVSLLSGIEYFSRLKKMTYE
jgi:CDP-diacylglycerol--glycerol-3-phosphate 3-phosphatidyltransferase